MADDAPANDPSNGPAPDTAGDPTDQPVDHPIDQPIDQPVDQPVDADTDRPIDGSVDDAAYAEPATRTDVVTAAPVPPTRSGLAAALAPLGAGLLGAAIAVSTVRTRSDGDLDVSVYAVGLGATVIALAIAALAAVNVKRVVGGRSREDAVTWPGVIGIVGVIAMVGVGVDSGERWFAYLLGALLAGLAAVGYVIARRPAFVVLAIAGLGLLYALAFEDVLADSLDGADSIVVTAGALGAFVVLVTVLGWLLPSRVVGGVVVGVVGVVGYVGILAALVVLRLVGDLFGAFASGLFSGSEEDLAGLEGMDGMSGMNGMDGMGSGSPFDSLGFSSSDVWWVLAFAGVLSLLWALASWISDASGFAVLAVLMPTLTVPLGAAALAVEHPTWWAAAVAAGGGVLVLAAALAAQRRTKAVAVTPH